MASEKTKTTIIVGVVALVTLLAVGGIAFLILKVRAQRVQARALEQLKQDNPVEYYVLHTPLKQSTDDLRQGMAGTWQLVGARSQRNGEFIVLTSPWNFVKIFSLTNWAIVTCDNNSNVLYSASGPYALQGDKYTESIEAATGTMTRYLGARPRFRIRLDGDDFYQIGAGRNPAIEEKWHRVGPGTAD